MKRGLRRLHESIGGGTVCSRRFPVPHANLKFEISHVVAISGTLQPFVRALP